MDGEAAAAGAAGDQAQDQAQPPKRRRSPEALEKRRQRVELHQLRKRERSERRRAERRGKPRRDPLPAESGADIVSLRPAELQHATVETLPRTLVKGPGMLAWIRECVEAMSEARFRAFELILRHLAVDHLAEYASGARVLLAADGDRVRLTLAPRLPTLDRRFFVEALRCASYLGDGVPAEPGISSAEPRRLIGDVGDFLLLLQTADADAERMAVCLKTLRQQREEEEEEEAVAAAELGTGGDGAACDGSAAAGDATLLSGRLPALAMRPRPEFDCLPDDLWPWA